MEIRREQVLELQRAYVERIRSTRVPYEVDHGGRRWIILPGVFPPYADSALVVRELDPRPGEKVLEVGTGSGFIAVTAALDGGEVTATDINPAAVGNALENARRHGVEGRLRALEADLFPQVGETFDLIVFNPPYTDHPAGDRLEASVWDPHHETVLRFLSELPRFLEPDGRLYLGWADFADLDFIESQLGAAGLSWTRAGSERDAVSLFVVYRAEWTKRSGPGSP